MNERADVGRGLEPASRGSWAAATAALVGLGLLGAGCDAGTATELVGLDVWAPPTDAAGDARAPDVPARSDTVAPDAGGDTDDGTVEDPDGGPGVPDGSRSGSDSDDADAPDAPEDVDPGPQPCDPPLAFTQSDYYALPFGLALLGGEVSGGTGDYSFSLTTADGAGSGALVNAATGTFLAGGLEGTSDTLAVTDGGCAGEATAAVHVVAPMTLAPSDAVVPPGTSFTPTVADGSGSVTVAVVQMSSGGSYTPGPDGGLGVYAAGLGLGTDVLEVTDIGTSEVALVVVQVAEDATFEAGPEVVLLAVDGEQALTLTGGSGHVSVAATPGFEGSVTVDDASGRLVGLEAGMGTLTVTDAFTGQVDTVEVRVADALDVARVRAGDRTLHAQVVGPGDLNGDGYPDAVVGHFEADMTAMDSGAVYVYAGVDGGLAPAPTQIFAGEAREDRMGRGVAVGDVTGDGRPDLVASSYLAHEGGGDTGRVEVFAGLDGGFFTDTAVQTIAGPQTFSQMGYGLALCDFDSDGWLDLVASARFAEDQELDPQPTSQGALFVFRGSDGGLSPTPSQSLWGVVPDVDGATDAGVLPFKDLQLGWDVVAADFDGDGHCDVAASSQGYEGSSGAVFVWRGVAIGEASPGGLWPVPVRAIAGFVDGDAGSQLGRDLAAGDVTGDGKAELLVARYRADTPGLSGTNHGAAHVFEGGEWATPDGVVDAWETPADASWTVYGDGSGDQFGWSVAVADQTGDGVPDVLVGSLTDEAPGGPNHTGTLHVYPGVEGALPSEEAARVVGGFSSYDYLGTALAGLGDLDGDGQGEVLAFASHDDTFGRDVGRPYVLYGHDDVVVGEDAGGGEPDPLPDGEEPELAPKIVGLDLPGTASGAQIGRGLAVGPPATPGGTGAVWVGSSEVDWPDTGTDQGAVTAFASLGPDAPVVAETAATATLGGFTQHSSADHLGWQVAAAGDFDGDGLEDLAALSRYDDIPGALQSGWVHGEADPATCFPSAGRGDRGALVVFRGLPGGGVEAAPAFLFYGPQASQLLEALAAPGDVNGDGKDDLIVGSWRHDRPGEGNAGAVMLVLGREAGDDGTLVWCTPDWLHRGFDGDDRLGYSVAGLGDLDGDGCAEFAAGGFLADEPDNNGGQVQIFRGWGSGAGPCPNGPTGQVLVPGLANPQTGRSLAGGHDVTGDGVPDLAVGGHVLSIGGQQVGGVWLVDGQWLLEGPWSPVVDGQLPGTPRPYVPDDALGVWRLEGTAAGGLFGEHVTLVPGVGPGDTAAVAVGAPLGDAGGVWLSGGVTVHRFWPGEGLEAAPWAVFGGEAFRPNGASGQVVASGWLDGRPVLLVGAPYGSALGLDEGSAYAFPLPVSD